MLRSKLIFTTLLVAMPLISFAGLLKLNISVESLFGTPKNYELVANIAIGTNNHVNFTTPEKVSIMARNSATITVDTVGKLGVIENNPYQQFHYEIFGKNADGTLTPKPVASGKFQATDHHLSKYWDINLYESQNSTIAQKNCDLEKRELAHCDIVIKVDKLPN